MEITTFSDWNKTIILSYVLILFIIDYSTTAFQESLSKKYNGIYSCTMLKHALKKILLTSSGSH